MKKGLRVLVFLGFFASCNNVQQLAYEVKLKKAVEYERTSNYSEALDLINQCIKIDSSDYFVYFLKGKILLDIYQPEDAIIQFNKALNMSPDDFTVLYYIGLCNYSLEKNKEAVFFLERAYSKLNIGKFYVEQVQEPNDLDLMSYYYVKIVSIRFFLGLSYYYLNDQIKAFNHLEFCISKNFNLSDCYLYSGMIYISSKLIDKGCEFLNKADSLGNKKAQTYLNLYCK